MKASARRLSFVAALSALVTLSAEPSGAQTKKGGLSVPTEPSTAPGPVTPTNVKALVGAEAAGRLLRSADPEDRLRGIERAAASGSAESVTLLVQAAEPSSVVRTDSRALLALARALARFAEQERARTALLAIVTSGNVGVAGRMPQARGEGSLALEEGDPAARVELARHVAALALATFGGDRAVELLMGAARGGGSGQAAALAALTAFPPRDPAFLGSASTPLPVPIVKMLGELGDLRTLERLHASARSPDPAVRAAAVLAIAQLGDERGIALARAAIVERDVRMRAAAGEALVLLGAPERVRAVVALIGDEATTLLGVRLAERVHDPEVVKLLAPRALVHPDAEVRSAAIQALGRSPDPAAAKALAAKGLIDDPRVGYHAALALARSPAPGTAALLGSLASRDDLRGLAVRAYVVRALLRGDRDDASEAAIARLASGKKPEERALAVFARVALGEASAAEALEDRDPAIRRAAVMGSLAHPTREAERAMLDRLATDEDPATRQVLALGLVAAGGATLPSNRLLDRAEGGGPDAPLASLAYARREDEGAATKIGQLLASKSPLVRAHTALGLGSSPLPDASGRLARAYASETELEVRRALVTALAARKADANAPSRKLTLEQAARLDPDASIRRLARAALDGAVAVLPASSPHLEVAWLRLVKDDGGAPGEPFVGAVVRADGIALPVAFDTEGFAVVAGLPPGEARLVLTPRLPR